MPTVLPKREAIEERYRWNIESTFATKEAWQEAFRQIEALLPELSRFQGHVGDTPQSLLRWMQSLESLLPALRRVYVYASMSRDVDTANQEAAGMFEQARGLTARVDGAIAFGEPEILAIGEDRLQSFIDQEPGLAIYRHYFDKIYKRRDHIRSPEVEALLGQVWDALRTPAVAHSTLTDADLSFGTVTTKDGELVEVAQGTISQILANPDRSLRKAAWEAYADGHIRFKNTLASCLAGGVKSNVFYARARGYSSALEAATSANYVPVEVFHNVLDTYHKNLHIWHRYWAVRRKALEVEKLHTYDLWAPLTQETRSVPFEQAVEWICAGMAPLGDAYVAAMRRGLLEERWVDVYPNQGKRSGAYSTGGPGTHPFILMSYVDNLFSLSTLAHELGHSMHSYLTWKTQPPIYADYTIFVAEVASNFNQALVRAYLLKAHEDDPEFQIAVIEEAMANFLRYFFIMPNLARFEYEIHQRVERGEPLIADSMSALMADLYREGYGDKVEVDPARDGITWATFSTHMYLNFYVYQYATGIAAANALADQILQGEPGAVERYLQFLRVGDSVYPLEALRMAGVDLTTPEPIERAFGVLSGLVDRLDRLVSART